MMIIDALFDFGLNWDES